MSTPKTLSKRQIWNPPTGTVTAEVSQCTSYQLPSHGILVVNVTHTTTLEVDAIFAPISCGQNITIDEPGAIPITGAQDPFYTSTIPQVFVLGAMLMVAWSLVVMLMLTPRASLDVRRHARGMLGATSSSSSLISVGGRPLLQKIAALLVACSLIAATVDTFRVVQDQYNNGYEDALAVTLQVVGSLELRILRVISIAFVWLAQVQTLIRLFPRHREKLIIKWVGISLIVLDVIFSLLNNFVYQEDLLTILHPRMSTEAVPALAYLFGLALSLLYTAWVFYYSLTKRHYAFFHTKMPTISLVALISLILIVLPVVFFVLDIADPNLASWGNYVRWAGGAAASVVVWEWVERIEALEREESQDGILGQEVFDGDDMTDSNRPRAATNNRFRTRIFGRDDDSDDEKKPDSSLREVSRRYWPHQRKRVKVDHGVATEVSALPMTRPSPASAASPVSRAESASTVYAVIHHAPSTTPSQDRRAGATPVVADVRREPSVPPLQVPTAGTDVGVEALSPTSTSMSTVSSRFPATLANPFKRHRSSPPAEVSRAAVDAHGAPSAVRSTRRSTARDMLRLRRRDGPSTDLPIVIVPAQPSGRIWTPPTDEADLQERVSPAKSEATPPTRSSPPSATRLSPPVAEPGGHETRPPESAPQSLSTVHERDEDGR